MSLENDGTNASASASVLESFENENGLRRTFCQVPFSFIYEQSARGKQSLHRLVEFFQKQAVIDKTASESLRDLFLKDQGLASSLDNLEEPGTSIRRALFQVRNFYEANASQQFLLARVLEEQVAEPLVALQKASEQYVQTLHQEIQNVNQELQQAALMHANASQRFANATEEMEDALDRQFKALQGIGVPEFELQRLAAKVSKCHEEQQQAMLAKQNAKSLLYHRTIARDEMAMAVSVAYQKAEEERLDQLHSCLQRFVHIEKERIKTAQNLVESLEQEINGINHAEDIQLLIDNHRDPDNLHFQGKALALLDWHWDKMHDHQQRDSDYLDEFDEEDEEETQQQHEQQPNGYCNGNSSQSTQTLASSTCGVNSLDKSEMGHALAMFFETSHYHHLPMRRSSRTRQATTTTTATSTAGAGAGAAPAPATNALQSLTLDDENDLVDEFDSEAIASPKTIAVVRKQRQEKLLMRQEDHDCLDEHCLCQVQVQVVCRLCEKHDGRVLFVKCLNRQRSVDTRIKNRVCFDALVQCFDKFLDFCHAQDDIKGAKTAMIMAETFYFSDQPRNSSTDTRSTRTYLQLEIKKHEIWTNPSFWEKALLLAIGEELQKTPQSCPWEELPSGVPKHEGVATREEAVCRVHNIVFGQLGSFTLSMLEFEVPLAQIQSFVETMCDAHELTEDQRFLLRRNLQHIFHTLRSS